MILPSSGVRRESSWNGLMDESSELFLLLKKYLQKTRDSSAKTFCGMITM